MMQIIDLSARNDLSKAELQTLIPRAVLDATVALETVLPLISDVKNRGTAAIREHAERFDRVTDHSLKVSESDIEEAHVCADPQLVTALNEMIRRVRIASLAQVPAQTVSHIIPGGSVTQRWQPVTSVGLYVPGGKAVYPSSVIMNVVAAQAAGVQNISIASPVQKATGGVHPTILTAAHLLGIKDVYAIGGASAIAAFAYGVSEIGLNPVDVVTGPGNIFVASAKRALQGVIGIDSEAGTTEILVLADETADPQNVAADLLSQAEHDEAAAAVLVTASFDLASLVQKEIEKLLAETEHKERARTALTGPQSAIIITDSIASAINVSNVYAPEHLSIQTADPHKTLEFITEAGAIFLNGTTPVSLGDYLAGSNHVLPTGGTARFSSGLGAHTFLRAQQIVEYTPKALANSLEHLTVIATAEGLPAHAAAAQIRFKEQ